MGYFVQIRLFSLKLCKSLITTAAAWAANKETITSINRNLRDFQME